GLVSYTLLILIRNIVAGLHGVPADVREAARGMGYTERQLLWRVEVPLAMPVIIAGVRIATVTTIGLVTVTALIRQGGLGALILQGYGQALSWLADGSHWVGTGGILQRLAEHLQMFLLVMLIASAIALPAGLLIGHAHRGAFLAVNAAGVGRALPTFAVLFFAFRLTLRYLPRPFGFWPTLIALVVLAVLPLLTNTFVAVCRVDPDAV